MYGYQATQLISVFYALIRIQVSPGNSGNEAAQVQGEMHRPAQGSAPHARFAHLG